jgi:hypothetical protein
MYAIRGNNKNTNNDNMDLKNVNSNGDNIVISNLIKIDFFNLKIVKTDFKNEDYILFFPKNCHDCPKK